MNISFLLTQKQIREGSKLVTRRLGWRKLQPGQILNACEKCQGLKKGAKVTVIRRIKVESVRFEPLNAITARDCALEGFPEMSPSEFVAMFCSHIGCIPTTEVTRIEFSYLP